MPTDYTLGIITVSAHDAERLERTLNSLQKIDSRVQHITIIPIEDENTANLWKQIQAKLQNNSYMGRDNNIGVYHAMNLGVEISNSEYLCFWNSGDELSSSANLSELVNFLVLNKPSWLVFQGEFSWREQQILSSKNVELFISHKSGAFISHQTVVVSKELFNKIGGFDFRYLVASDTDQISKYFKLGKPMFFDETVVRVEKPRFASKHNRKARIEVVLITLRNLRGKKRFMSLFNILFFEGKNKLLKFNVNLTKKTFSNE